MRVSSSFWNFPFANDCPWTDYNIFSFVKRYIKFPDGHVKWWLPISICLRAIRHHQKSNGDIFDICALSVLQVVTAEPRGSQFEVVLHGQRLRSYGVQLNTGFEFHRWINRFHCMSMSVHAGFRACRSFLSCPHFLNLSYLCFVNKFSQQITFDCVSVEYCEFTDISRLIYSTARLYSIL